jgi:hypothetical protein
MLINQITKKSNPVHKASGTPKIDWWAMPRKNSSQRTNTATMTVTIVLSKKLGSIQGFPNQRTELELTEDT